MSKMKLLFLVIIFFLINPAFAAMAQEVVVPGLAQAPTESNIAPAASGTGTGPIPQTKTSQLQNPLGNKNLKMPSNATDEQLQQLITSVDLQGWSVFAYNLWTCTPSHYNLSMYNAKNDMQDEFDKYKEKKKILTKEKATQIATEIAQPVDIKIPGLMGISCGVNIMVSNRKKPYLLKCFFIMLDAKYLANLSRAVADNSGKADVLPSDTLTAIQNLLNSNCTKTT